MALSVEPFEQTMPDYPGRQQLFSSAVLSQTLAILEKPLLGFYVPLGLESLEQGAVLDCFDSKGATVGQRVVMMTGSGMEESAQPLYLSGLVYLLDSETDLSRTLTSVTSLKHQELLLQIQLLDSALFLTSEMF